MTALTIGGQSENKVQLAGRGYTGERLMSRKEYRAKFGLSRGDAERQHNEYLRANGVLGNADISGRIARGELLITGAKVWQKSGKFQLAGVLASSVVDKAPKSDERDAKIAELEAKLAALSAKAA